MRRPSGWRSGIRKATCWRPSAPPGAPSTRMATFCRRRSMPFPVRCVVGREVRIVHDDGTFFDVVVSAAPIRDPEQNIIAAVATFADVTERKRMEDALRKSEENFRRTFDQSPLGAAMVSMD